jgi:transcriptional regulator with XRE-family HTH domain
MKPRELIAWRDKQFLSQHDLAELLGVHKNTVSNWENGKTRIPAMAELAFEAITQQRARLIKQLMLKRRELAEQRRLKALAQGVDLEAFKRKTRTA